MFGCGGGAAVFRFIRHDSLRPRTASAAGSEKVAEVLAQLFVCFKHSFGWLLQLPSPPLSSVPSGLVFRPHGSVASREVNRYVHMSCATLWLLASSPQAAGRSPEPLSSNEQTDRHDRVAAPRGLTVAVAYARTFSRVRTAR